MSSAIARNVLIVGASRGLGLEFVRQYRADGAKVDENEAAEFAGSRHTYGHLNRRGGQPAEANGPDPAGFAHGCLDGGELGRSRDARLVNHDVLAAPHCLDGQARPIAGYRSENNEIHRWILK